MNARAAILIALLAVAVALGGWLLWRATGDEHKAPEPAPTLPIGSSGETAGAKVEQVALPDSGDGGREPAPARSEPVPMTTFAQGLRGLTIDGNGAPLTGIDVYLVESAGNEPLALAALQQQHAAFGPLVATRSAADGTFAVGLPVVQDRVYELYLVSPVHALVRLGGLRLLADEWHDLGAITMQAGAIVRGRVTIVGRPDLPVPRATVSLTVGTVFSDVSLRALPDAAPGLSAEVDQHGNYELRHAPSRGSVLLTAVAPGFARVVKSDIQLDRDRPAEVDFALPPGLALAGTLRDEVGRPVAGARVEAWPQTASGSALLGRSDGDGRFTVLGLQAGPHRLRVQARGFEPFELLDLAAGRGDLEVVLQPRARIRVRATTPTGAVLRAYRLSLRRVFEGSEQLGMVADVPEQRVRLDGFTDRAELADLPPGRFVCQVEADGYAKSWSAPFDTTRPAGQPVGPAQVLETEVVVQVGSRLLGIAVDETGAPLAGATVTTQAAGALPDSPLFQTMAPAVPARITARQVTTDSAGRFTLDQLAAGTYQLMVEHPAACRAFVRDLRLSGAEEQTVPPVVLPIGAELQGRVTVAGRPSGQIKVVFSSSGGRSGPESLRIETITAADGRFRLPRRVPPGNYELRAAVVGTAEPEAQIFRQLLQLQRSALPIVILPGQRRAEHDLDLPADR